MAALLRWTRPKAAADWEWQRALGTFKRSALLFAAYVVLIAVPLTYLANRVRPSLLDSVMPGIWCVPILGAAGVYVLAVVFFRPVEEYELRAEGLRVGPSHERTYIWAIVDAFRLVDHPTMHGLRRLEFRIKGPRLWLRWSFDPAEVDRARLRAILEEHLPGKCWDNVPRTSGHSTN